MHRTDLERAKEMKMPFRVGLLEVVIVLIIALLRLSPFVLLIYLLISKSGQNRDFDKDKTLSN
jgi:hypothetical protein